MSFQKKLVRAEGLEPSRAEAQRIFLPSTAFVARTQRFEARASGLRSGLSLHRSPEKPRLRCCPSSLYTFLVGMLDAQEHGACLSGLARDCHFRFPRIWAVLHRRFPRRALKFSLSPLRMPFRHARARLPDCISIFYHRADAPGFTRQFPGSVAALAVVSSAEFAR